MPSNEERIEERTRRIVGELEGLVLDLASAGGERVAAVEEEAEAAIGRHADASNELDSVRRKIVEAEAEREQIPARAYRAGLDEDYELEDRLKVKYRDLKPTIEALRARVVELETELAALVGPNPTPRGDLDATIHAYEHVRDAYRDAAAPLVSLQTRVSALLRDAVDPLVGGHRATGQTLQGLRGERDGDPAVRARSMERRGIRPEFVGAKPKPGV